MLYPKIIHHGVIDGVTGSCHQLELDAVTSLLIGCGAFQGIDAELRKRLGASSSEIELPVETIITHVHVDHAGRLPDLTAAGFKGPILCSEPSAKLLPLVLEDVSTGVRPS